MSDQLEFLARNGVNLLIGFPNHRPGGLLLSILLSASAIVVGAFFSLFLGAGAHSRYWIIRRPTLTLIQVLRGVPLVLMLLIVHQFLGTGRLGLTTSSLISAFVTLVLYSAAYQADIVQAGFRSVPSELTEGARVLGSSPLRTYLTVTLPYGFRVMRPALLSQAITVFKDSSVVVVLGVADLTTTARIALGSDINNAPYWVTTYLAVGFLYFLVAFGLSRVVERNDHKQVLSGLSAS